jgi:hypothetical protein
MPIYTGNGKHKRRRASAFVCPYVRTSIVTTFPCQRIDGCRKHHSVGHYALGLHSIQ